MESFGYIKESLGKNIKQFCNYIEDIVKLVSKISSENYILKNKLPEEEIDNVIKLGSGFNINLIMIARSKMKCSFFGKTSNGKSAVINAMLRDKVLPSSIGRTTSCFITVEGCPEGDGYFVNIDESIMQMSQLEDVASEFGNANGIDSQIKVFWPIIKCSFLQHEVQLLDSPGCDVSNNNDSWIEKYCLDSDVFVYVVDAQSTLNQSERDFFLKVKNKIGNPILFILLNKWDLCRNTSSESKLRQQHISTIEQFMKDDMSRSCDWDNRIFFISAMENLTEYEPVFQEFINSLSRQMTVHAVVTKFKQHSDKGIESLRTTINFVDKLLSMEKSKEYQYIGTKIQIKNFIEEIFQNIEQDIIKNLISQCHSYVPTIAKEIRLNQFKIDDVSTFMDNHFMEIFEHLQKTIVESILPKITEYLITTSNIEVDATLMSNYVPTSLKEVMLNYKSKLKGKNIKSHIKDAYNELEAYTRSTKLWGKYKNISDFKISVLPSIIGRIYYLITTLKDKITRYDRQGHLERDLKIMMSDYLNETATYVINEFKADIVSRIIDKANIFVDDCIAISKLMTDLETIRISLENLTEGFELIQAEIERLNTE